MIVFRRAADHIQNKYESWKSDAKYGRKGWLDDAVDSEELYMNDVDGTGTTFTQKQRNIISSSTDIPISVNFLYPIVNQKLALLISAKPSTKTMSLDGRAKDEAMVLDKMKTGLFNVSNTKMELESHIKDSLITGIGFMMVTPGNFYQPGLFGLRVGHIPYDEVILDINAKKEDLDDMEGFFIERELTLPKTMQMYGNIISQLKEDNGQPVSIETLTSDTWVEQGLTDKASVTTANWNTDEKVVVREYYEKVFTTMYAMKDPDTQVINFEFEENLPEEAKFQLANAEYKIEDIYIKKTLILGGYEVFNEILPINDYPLVASFYEWSGRPYSSHGIIHFNKDAQRASDKILQIMTLNGILTNNAGWVAPKGSISTNDKSKWEEHGNDPRVVKEYVAQEINGVLLKPEREQVQQLSNFYPLVLGMIRQGIEYSSGINAILQGNANEASVDVFSSLQQYQNSAMQRVLLSANHINNTMKNLGEVLVQYLTASITPDTFQFFDETGKLNELKIALGMVNSIKKYKYQVIAIPSTYMPSQKLSSAMELMKIAQSSPDAAERSILTQKAMSLSEVKEYDDVQEKLDITKRTQSELEQLQKAYERLMETSKQMENKYINVSLENQILKRLAKGAETINSSVNEAKADIRVAKEKEVQKATPTSKEK